MRRQHHRSLRKTEDGSVTAELALTLPTVSLVLAVCISGFGLQIEKMKFVSVASSAARALGRGEARDAVEQLAFESAPGVVLKLEFLENYVCAVVSRSFPVLGLQQLEISERQCARKLGL